MLQRPSLPWVRLSVWLALGLLTSGCRPAGSSSQAPPSPLVPAPDNTEPTSQANLTIAVIPKSTGGEFWETVEKGARAAAQELQVSLRWEGTLTETEIAEQNKIIENMVSLGVAGLAVAPLNAQATRKPVEAAVEAGVPVVLFDSEMEGNRHVSFVATDNRAGGALAGKFLVEKLQGQGDILALRYLQGTGSTEARMEGFLETIRQGGLRAAADVYCEDGTVAGAKKSASSALEQFVQEGRLALAGIFACNLYSAMGMADALDDLRKSGITVDTIFVGFDTSPTLLKGLESGTVHALIAQNPERMGYLAVETLVKHLRHESISPRVDTGVELLTWSRLSADPVLRQRVGLP